MTIRFHLARALLAVTTLTTVTILGACDGGSGLGGSDKVSTLSASDREQLCDWYTDVLDAPREVQCGFRTRRFLSSAECQRRLDDLRTSCPVTVDQYEECIEATADDPCATPDACKTLSSCD